MLDTLKTPAGKTDSDLDPQARIRALQDRIQNREAKVGVIGLGYVGLPLALSFCNRGFQVLGFDVDPDKVEDLNGGRSYIKHIPADGIADVISSQSFRPTADFNLLSEVDAILICVPTPLSSHREPDLSFVTKTAEAISRHLRRDQLVVLESTTYPGTTAEVLTPILEQSGLKAGEGFFLAFSPEREDPSNPDFHTVAIPKVVGSDNADALVLTETLYGEVFAKIVPVSSAATAEAVKLTENIFRAVNIALVNELKVIYERMDIDVWEVIDAAKTKPFGFMAFYPGPGLGGHCIPIDPFYLSWKAQEHGISTRFIELAGQINVNMPAHVVDKLAAAVDQRFAKGLNGAKILILGVAYKRNVDDMRESPALTIMDLLRARGAQVSYYDPFVEEISATRDHATLEHLRTINWDPDSFDAYDAALICTDHDGVDYDALVQHSRLVVDTRNATKDVTAGREKIVRA